MGVNWKKTNSVVGLWKLVCVGLPLLLSSSVVRGQEQPFAWLPSGNSGALLRISTLEAGEQARQDQLGTIVGKVVDQSGTNVPGAVV
jgi:hypothetical protein